MFNKNILIYIMLNKNIIISIINYYKNYKEFIHRYFKLVKFPMDSGSDPLKALLLLIFLFF